jgi:hypothetical protein
MMKLLSVTTIDSLLGLKFRNTEEEFIPTLLSAMKKTSRNDSFQHFVVSVFGLLSKVSQIAKGSALLRNLSIRSLAMDTIQSYFDTPRIHEIAFTLLRNVLLFDKRENDERQTNDLIELILKSATKYPREEALQENACRLLVALVSQSNDGCQEARRLIQSTRGRRILSKASKNFPESCQEVVCALLLK